MHTLFLEEAMSSTNDCALYVGKDHSNVCRKFIKVCKNPDRWNEFREAFEKEYSLMKDLSFSCSTLPSYDGTGTFILRPYRNAPCIITEYIEGITLKDYLEDCWKNRWPRTAKEPTLILPKEALSRICQQVYETICFLYRHNIVYFDLSPSNIMIINDQFDIKLIDFTFCCNRNAPGHHKQYVPDGLITTGRPLPAALTRTLLFFFARLFYSSEYTFSTLNASIVTQESFYFKRKFHYTFDHLYENEDLSQDVLIQDESCCSLDIEKQLELPGIYYDLFMNCIDML